MMELELKEWGNSTGVIIPVDKLREYGANKGDRLLIEIVGKKKVDGFGIFKGALPLEGEREGHEELI